jgi:hypothetical protein
MRTLIVLFALCGLVIADAGWGRALIAGRLKSQSMRMDVLGHELDKLVDRVRHIDSNELDETVEDLEHRILHLEGDECDDRHFSCGRNSGECITEMLACDGHEDCENGHDESEEFCKNPVQPGRAWSGYIDWQSCVNRGHDKVNIVITSNKRIDWFPARLQIAATVALTHDQDGHPVTEALSTVGEYSFGTGKMFLQPSDDSPKRIGAICEDAGKNMAHCKFLSEADLHVCGEGIFTSVGVDS